MKKSKAIKLAIVAGLLSACGHDKEPQSRLHIRGDSTSEYTRTPYYHGMGFYHFIPFGFYAAGRGYQRGGYESTHFSSKATSSSSHISRGGFGGGTRVGG